MLNVNISTLNIETHAHPNCSFTLCTSEETVYLRPYLKRNSCFLNIKLLTVVVSGYHVITLLNFSFEVQFSSCCVSFLQPCTFRSSLSCRVKKKKTTKVHYNKQNPTRRVMSYHDVNAMLTIKPNPRAVSDQDQHWELHFCTSLPKHICERQNQFGLEIINNGGKKKTTVKASLV